MISGATKTITSTHHSRIKHTARFSGKQLHYYNNSSVSFRVLLLLSGDVHPNPDPPDSEDIMQHQISMPKISYGRNAMLHSNACFFVCPCCKIKISIYPSGSCIGKSKTAALYFEVFFLARFLGFAQASYRCPSSKL